MTSSPARGRRQGRSTSRELIVASARKLFAERGFAATSLREIARDAGVDPALVHHYFSGKDDLFNACVALPADPDEVLSEVSGTPPAERGEALLRALLTLWDSPAQAALVALLRSATASTTHGSLVRVAVVNRILPRTVAGLPGDEDVLALRSSLVASTVMGLMMARYLLRLEPLASATHNELVAWFAPSLQASLTGPLPGDASKGPVAPGMGSSPHGRTAAGASTVEVGDIRQSRERA
ncbi:MULTISPECIES: TetR/AcrR family transcriptional regulator [Arthrobacter]|uniref:TetR/AcrR family transcriptional regulator n=1 Tax=Arthrobacter TaxID=1663 RepID=UPI0009EC16FE|nr:MULTISPECIES: TetR family transcriptional regulator [Arthrobacter]